MAVTKAASPRTGACRRRRCGTPLAALTAATVMAFVGSLGLIGTAFAATATVSLGTVGSYSVIAGPVVSNTGPSRLSGDVGVSPGRAITGFSPGVTARATRVGNAAAQAKRTLDKAYGDAASREPTAAIPAKLVNENLKPGVYRASESLQISGSLTLDAENAVDSVFVLQVPDDLDTASASQVRLVNGADACNVFWQVGRSATLGNNSQFVGTIMALQSIKVTKGAKVLGRVLARNGSVTLDTNVFTSAGCAAPAATPTRTVTVAAAPTVTTTSPRPTTITSASPVVTNTSAVRARGPNTTSVIARTAAAGGGTYTTTLSITTSTSTITSTSTSTNSSNLADTGSGPLLPPLIVGGVSLAVLGTVLVLKGRRPKGRHT
jgi:hypothetical protein